MFRGEGKRTAWIILAGVMRLPSAGEVFQQPVKVRRLVRLLEQTNISLGTLGLLAMAVCKSLPTRPAGRDWWRSVAIPQPPTELLYWPLLLPGSKRWYVAVP